MKESQQTIWARGMLRIMPLAPLSMVSSVPGSFYRSSHEPSAIMIYGMLENIVGWHYSPEIRKSLKKAVLKRHKKSKEEYVSLSAESGFEPFIQNYIKVTRLFLRPSVQTFTDLWTQHQKHNDKRHFDGVRNYDWRYVRQINSAGNDPEKAALLKEHTSHFPNYYQSPKRREYIIASGEFIYEIQVADIFVNQLMEAINNPVSTPYLGTSEGWVDVNIELV